MFGLFGVELDLDMDDKAACPLLSPYAAPMWMSRSAFER